MPLKNPNVLESDTLNLNKEFLLKINKFSLKFKNQYLEDLYNKQELPKLANFFKYFYIIYFLIIVNESITVIFQKKKHLNSEETVEIDSTSLIYISLSMIIALCLVIIVDVLLWIKQTKFNLLHNSLSIIISLLLMFSFRKGININ